MDSILSAGAAELGIKQAGFWSMTGRPTYFIRATNSKQWQEVSAKLAYCKGESKMQSNGLCNDGSKVTKPENDSFSKIYSSTEQ